MNCIKIMINIRRYVLILISIAAIPSFIYPQGNHFDYKRQLFEQNPTLNANVEHLNRETGEAIVNGGDSAQPKIPFLFDWGDGNGSAGFFPQKHVYLNRRKNYIVRVTARYPNGRTDYTETIVRFRPPMITPVSLPQKTMVSIPSEPVILSKGTHGYRPPQNLSFFDDGFFSSVPRSTIEYVLSVAAAIQMDYCHENVSLPDGNFHQVFLRDPKFQGMHCLWFTNPVGIGCGDYAFRDSVQYSSLFHEMGHNVTLNFPAHFHFGGKIDGCANAIYSETMAQIFQHATACDLVNNASGYGLSEDLAMEIGQSAIDSVKIIRNSYERYNRSGRKYCSWNNPQTSQDETFDTFMTIAYKFLEHAEKSRGGYNPRVKRLMAFLGNLDENMRKAYDQRNNSQQAETFRATFMVAALSYSFNQDLRQEFKELGFPVSDAIYLDLMNKAEKPVPSLTP